MLPRRGKHCGRGWQRWNRFRKPSRSSGPTALPRNSAPGYPVGHPATRPAGKPGPSAFGMETAAASPGAGTGGLPCNEVAPECHRHPACGSDLHHRQDAHHTEGGQACATFPHHAPRNETAAGDDSDPCQSCLRQISLWLTPPRESYCPAVHVSLRRWRIPPARGEEGEAEIRQAPAAFVSRGGDPREHHPPERPVSSRHDTARDVRCSGARYAFERSGGCWQPSPVRSSEILQRCLPRSMRPSARKETPSSSSVARCTAAPPKT